MEYLRTGLSSFKQNSARGGRGFTWGFGLRTGGLGGLRTGGVSAAPAPAVGVAPAGAAGVAGVAGVALALLVGAGGVLFDDASVVILCSL